MERIATVALPPAGGPVAALTAHRAVIHYRDFASLTLAMTVFSAASGWLSNAAIRENFDATEGISPLVAGSEFIVRFRDRQARPLRTHQKIFPINEKIPGAEAPGIRDYRKACHCEPVTDVTGVAIRSPNLSKDFPHKQKNPGSRSSRDHFYWITSEAPGPERGDPSRSASSAAPRSRW